MGKELRERFLPSDFGCMRFFRRKYLADQKQLVFFWLDVCVILTSVFPGTRCFT